MATLEKDFREFLQCLISRRVRFVVVGAHALAAHGRPRYTGDLDVLVSPTLANARRLMSALGDFGFGSVSNLTAGDIAEPGQVIQLGVPPVRIDVLTSISGVTFAAAWRGRLPGRLAGMEVPFLGIRQFIANKRAAGRPKDLADIALLEEVSPPSPRAPTRRSPDRK